VGGDASLFIPGGQVRLRQLNHKAGERPLTQAEAAEQERLLDAYHRSVLRRAKALLCIPRKIDLKSE
jgi:uncharacterized protein YnzC (UPF0291/DUF896 family)